MSEAQDSHNVSMTSLTRTTRAAALYRAVMIVAGAALLVPLFTRVDLVMAVGAVLFLSAMAFVAERAPIELPGYGIVSGLEAAVLAALFLGQTSGAVAVLAVGVLSRSLRRGKAFRWDFAVYTFFQLGLCFALPFALCALWGLRGPPASSSRR